jgi:hypothetical protein
MCNWDCDHDNYECFKNANMICEDHTQHNIINENYPYNENDAFNVSMKNGNIKHICVRTKKDQECEWDGVCSLKFVKQLDTYTILAEDKKGTQYYVPQSSIEAFE